jgi:hypothetical protein
MSDDVDWVADNGKYGYGPQAMVFHLGRVKKAPRTKAGRRKLRLFACGCCRLLWEMLTDGRLREAVMVAERFADDDATKSELEAAYREVHDSGLAHRRYLSGEIDAGTLTAAHMAEGVASERAFAAAFWQTAREPLMGGYSFKGFDGGAVLRRLLCCVFMPYFRPVALERGWRTTTAVTLARSIYEERAFERCPILADALEDAGCTDVNLLTHLREDELHCRGCHAIDAVLGKKQT